MWLILVKIFFILNLFNLVESSFYTSVKKLGELVELDLNAYSVVTELSEHEFDEILQK